MFKDKTIRAIMFGESNKIEEIKNSRTTTINFPYNGEELGRSITFMADDGCVLHLIRMIEKLEKRIISLEDNKSTTCKKK